MSNVSDSIRRLFPEELSKMKPVKRGWKQRLNQWFVEHKGKYVAGSVFLIFFILTHVYYYNEFVKLESQLMADKSQIEVHLQRRKNLIINLAQLVLEYGNHEEHMFKYMADLRAGSLGQNPELLKSLQEKGMIDPARIGEKDVKALMGGLLAISESYPNLRLSENFQRFMDALVDIENRISERRMAYNNSCNVYSTYVRLFPQKLLAASLRFADYDFIKVDDDVYLFNQLKPTKNISEAISSQQSQINSNSYALKNQTPLAEQTKSQSENVPAAQSKNAPASKEENPSKKPSAIKKP